MKIKFFPKIVLFFLIIFLSCSSVNNYGDITNTFLEEREIVNPDTIDITKIPEGKTIIIGRIVFYIDNNIEIINNTNMELGFLPLSEILYTKNRLKETKFYKIKLDKEGYFFLQLDSTPISLFYIYIELYDKVFSIPSGAILDINENSKIIYAGEVQIIKRDKHNNHNEYYLDTLFNFYNNSFKAFEYLNKQYSINPKNIKIVPFYVPINK